MGTDPKASVANPSCALDDVPNVFLAAAASFVSRGSQSTT
jgi:choline dehydrogenase-like flavoprotein